MQVVRAPPQPPRRADRPLSPLITPTSLLFELCRLCFQFPGELKQSLSGRIEHEPGRQSLRALGLLAQGARTSTQVRFRCHTQSFERSGLAFPRW
jgi:hypothetical protein